MKKIIIGIDPGYGRTGWGIVQYKDTKATFCAAGCIETSPDLIFSQRLVVIFDSITTLISKYNPIEMAVESLFFNSNAKTVIDASQARGVAVLAGVKRHLSVFDYTPLQVKQSLIGYGRGDKKQVQAMLKQHLDLETLPKLDDACDALAVALTHAYTNQQLR